MDERHIDEYAKLDEMASPLFIEPKGYVFVGYSRKRMNCSNMPYHNSVHDFGIKLADRLGYNLAMERPDSMAILLARDPKITKIVKQD
jgi:tRNA wybutosine-synthesizing protein 1